MSNKHLKNFFLQIITFFRFYQCSFNFFFFLILTHILLCFAFFCLFLSAFSSKIIFIQEHKRKLKKMNCKKINQHISYDRHKRRLFLLNGLSVFNNYITVHAIICVFHVSLCRFERMCFTRFFFWVFQKFKLKSNFDSTEFLFLHTKKNLLVFSFCSVFVCFLIKHRYSINPIKCDSISVQL